MTKWRVLGALFCHSWLLLACASWLPPTPDLALDASFCPVSAVSRAVMGTVQWQQDDATQAFFVALEYDSAGASVTLVSLQGVPLYQISCGPDGMKVQRQAMAETMLPPKVLLQALGLAFSSEELLSKYLLPGWSLSFEGRTRFFFCCDEHADTMMTVALNQNGDNSVRVFNTRTQHALLFDLKPVLDTDNEKE